MRRGQGKTGKEAKGPTAVRKEERPVKQEQQEKIRGASYSRFLRFAAPSLESSPVFSVGNEVI